MHTQDYARRILKTAPAILKSTRNREQRIESRERTCERDTADPRERARECRTRRNEATKMKRKFKEEDAEAVMQADGQNKNSATHTSESNEQCTKKKQKKSTKYDKKKKSTSSTSNNTTNADMDASETANDSSKQSAALEYLNIWKNQRAEWKFSKLRQSWLLRHLYDEEAIDKKNFKILLAYLEKSNGQARQATLNHAKELVQKYETELETNKDSQLKMDITQEGDAPETDAKTKHYERAKKILKALIE